MNQIAIPDSIAASLKSCSEHDELNLSVWMNLFPFIRVRSPSASVICMRRMSDASCTDWLARHCWLAPCFPLATWILHDDVKLFIIIGDVTPSSFLSCSVQFRLFFLRSLLRFTLTAIRHRWPMLMPNICQVCSQPTYALQKDFHLMWRMWVDLSMRPTMVDRRCFDPARHPRSF